MPGLFLCSDFYEYKPIYLCKYLEVFINNDHYKEVLILPRVLKFRPYFHWCKSEPVMTPKIVQGDLHNDFLSKVIANLNKVWI